LIFSQSVLAHIPHDYVTQIKTSPIYAQDNIVFILVRNNLFKSQDGGKNWQRIVRGLDHKYPLSSLSISQNYNQDNTLIVSTNGDGIYQSRDGGISWKKINNNLVNLDLDRVEFSPHSSQKILALGREKGLYLTTNGGVSWQEVINNNHQITSIAYAPNNLDYIMAGDSIGNIYISNNGGQKWNKLSKMTDTKAITAIAISPNFALDKTAFLGTENKGIIKVQIQNNLGQEIKSDFSNQYIQDIVITPNNQKKSLEDYTIYLSTWDQAVYKSNDRGNSWQKLSQGITKTSQADQLKNPHFYDLEISTTFPEDKTIFLGGFDGLFQSKDAGNNWQQLETLSPRIILDIKVSPNYSNDSTIALITYLDEAYISKDKGKTWQALNKGLEPPLFTRKFKNEPHTKRFYQLLFSPNYQQDKTLFATLLWTKLLKYTGTTNSWKIFPLPKEERLPTMAISPNFAQDKTIYIASQKGKIYKSINGGQNFNLVGKIPPKFGNQSPSMAISPNFSLDGTIFASGKEGIYKSTDRGKKWIPISRENLLAKGYDFNLAISPNYQNDRTVLVASSNGLFKSKDGGKTWLKLLITNQNNDYYIQGITISPNYTNDHTFLVSVRGKGLFKTEDEGNTFTNIGDKSIALAVISNFENAASPMVFSPSYSQDKTIYAVGSAASEIFVSTDAGNNWNIIPIPRDPIFEDYEKDRYNFMTRLKLMIYLQKRSIFILSLAIIAGIISYFASGILLSQKKLPFNKVFIKSIISFLIFIFVFLLIKLL
jgi:photosystem II stability/assembly factor-like uncharacterized protein